MYSIQTICEVVKGRFLQQHQNDTITTLLYDSRHIQLAEEALFFALQTPHSDGHIYVADAYAKGVRNFIVSRTVVLDNMPDSNIILVDDTLAALQQLAIYHRQHFAIPVIGITGSNGKTIVKEWLYQLLEADYHIVRSPKSYNSQIGVPLSIWQMNYRHTLAIFEAGISQPGEMQILADIIQPTIGIITNIGEAHSSGFASLLQKAEEKIKLVQKAGAVIYGNETLPPDFNITNHIAPSATVLNWSFTTPAAITITNRYIEGYQTHIAAIYQQHTYAFVIPFTDEASVQNALQCISVLLYLNYTEATINERLAKLHSIDMRLQLKHGINGCLLVNDSYSADITSLEMALNFQQQQASGLTKTVILSDFLGSDESDEQLYHRITQLLHRYHIEKVMAIGEKWLLHQPNITDNIAYQFYPGTEAFIERFRSSQFVNEIILIKGARLFAFERIVALLQTKVHQTVLEINLNAIAHNLKAYQKLVQPGTKIMAMVKAFAYGSGGAEIAGVLQYHHAAYLGVAYIDEGVELRKAGISLPIMVMNTEESAFASLVNYNLQPVIYSFGLLQAFEQYISSQGLQHYPVHIEIETGMNRLGFAAKDIDELGQRLSDNALLKVQTVFSHLAASEDAAQDDFTQLQASRFATAAQQLKPYIPYPFLQHIANSAAIIRHPQLQLDMVRLGIGLYGVESDGLHMLDLQAVATLRSTIAQLKYVKAGETVSYNRKGVVHRNSVIATVRIGYADGYSRRFGNGVGKMWVRGQWAPVIGTVCMDMTMIDVTDIPGVQTGDDVILFGPQLPVQYLAQWIGTIPYEIMTSISQRVKRVYFQE